MTTEYHTEAERLSEQFQSLMQHKMVLDWWQKQLTEIRYGYQGVSHALNKSIADYAKTRKELIAEIDLLKERYAELLKEREEANATIGKLQTDLVAVSERLDRMAEWAKKQKGIEK